MVRRIAFFGAVGLWLQILSAIADEHKPILFPDHDEGSSEEDCIADGQILHSDGHCYYLLDQGPCPQNYWFVLDKRRDYEAVCKPRPCPDPFAIMYGGKCVQVGQSAGCNPTLGLVVTPFGEGVCGCFPGFTYDVGSKTCQSDSGKDFELKTILNFPFACQPGTALDRQRMCRQATSRQKPLAKNRARTLSVMMAGGPRLLKFLLHRRRLRG